MRFSPALPPAWVAALIFLAAAPAAVVVGRLWLKQWLPPAAVLVGVWSATAGLYCLRLLPYRPLSKTAAWLLASSCAFFLAGMALGGALGRQRVRLGELAREAARGRRGRVSPWIAFYTGLGMAGMAWYVASVTRTLGGWSVWRDGSVVRGALGTLVPGNFYWLEYFCLAAPLVAWAAWLAGGRVEPYARVLAGSCVLALWITTDRTQFFMLMLASMYMYLYRHPELRLAEAGRVVAGVAFILIVNFLAVGYWTRKTPARLRIPLSVATVASGVDAAGGPAVGAREVPAGNAGKAEGTPLARPLQTFTILYLYATGSYPAFSRLLEREPAHTMGRFTFYPIFRLVQKLGLGAWPGLSVIPPNVVISSSGVSPPVYFNAYTYLYYYYEDFGAAGVLIVPLALGLFAGWVAASPGRWRASPGRLILLGQVAMAITLTTAFNKFNDTATWYVTAVAILPFATRPREKSADAPGPVKD